MKLLKKIMPLATIASAGIMSASLTTSCSTTSAQIQFKGIVNNKFVKYESKITPLGGELTEKEVIDKYCEEVKKNPKIFCDDFLSHVAVIEGSVEKGYNNYTVKLNSLNQTDGQWRVSFEVIQKFDYTFKDSVKGTTVRQVADCSNVFNNFPLNVENDSYSNKWSVFAFKYNELAEMKNDSKWSAKTTYTTLEDWRDGIKQEMDPKVKEQFDKNNGKFINSKNVDDSTKVSFRFNSHYLSKTTKKESPSSTISMEGSNNTYTSSSYSIAANTQYTYTNVKVLKDALNQLPTTLSFTTVSSASVCATKTLTVKVNGKSATNYQQLVGINTCTLPTGINDGDSVEIIATFDQSNSNAITAITLS